jgi:hypothetical protein
MSANTAKKRKSQEPPKGIRAHKTLLASVLAIATILGGVAVVLPRPSVTPNDPVDPSNPMSASFTVTNSSIIPLRHVTAYVAIGQVANISAKLDPNFEPTFTSRLFRPEWRDHTLDMDERFTITPADVFGSGWGEADIAIGVIYRPWFFPMTREKNFRFKTHRQTNGSLYWYSVPMK